MTARHGKKFTPTEFWPACGLRNGSWEGEMDWHVRCGYTVGTASETVGVGDKDVSRHQLGFGNTYQGHGP